MTTLAESTQQILGIWVPTPSTYWADYGHSLDLVQKLIPVQVTCSALRRISFAHNHHPSRRIFDKVLSTGFHHRSYSFHGPKPRSIPRWCKNRLSPPFPQPCAHRPDRLIRNMINMPLRPPLHGCWEARVSILSVCLSLQFLARKKSVMLQINFDFHPAPAPTRMSSTKAGNSKDCLSKHRMPWIVTKICCSRILVCLSSYTRAGLLTYNRRLHELLVLHTSYLSVCMIQAVDLFVQLASRVVRAINPLQ